ncbi:MAG: DDE-type integrase/transposase/recombinase [Mycobacterium sp.]
MSEQESGRIEARRRAQRVALFRYQVICPALDPTLTGRQRGPIVRAIAKQAHDHPFVGKVRYSRDHLDRWIRSYRAGGFDALVPSVRQTGPRTDGQTLDLAAGLKAEIPGRTAAQVARILRSSTGWSPSESTLLRLFHRRELMGPGAGITGEVFGRFEATEPNERWAGDALHGPRIAGRKTYLFAFIDDHTRLVTGYRFGFAEDTVRLSAAFEKALTSRGVPKMLYVDNGAAYVDAWLLRACGKLGVRLVHATPYRPQGKGKIERFFRTVRDQFLIEVTDDAIDKIVEAHPAPAAALAEVNRLFTAWVETVYHRAVHSETGRAPIDRWDTFWAETGHLPALPSGPDLAEAFKWSELRTVTKTATVSLHGNTYQVEPALSGRRVELIFSPFDMTVIEVRYQDKTFGAAIPHVIGRHTHPKARPETPAASPPVTGIDYLNLVAADDHRQRQADERIGYDALYGRAGGPGQLPGQMSLDDLADGDTGRREETA